MANESNISGDSNSGRVSIRELLDTFNRQVTGLQTEIREFRDDAKSITETMRNSATMLDRVQYRLESMETQIKEFREKGTTASQQRISILEERLKVMDNRMAENDKERHNLRNEIQVRLTKLDELRMISEKSTDDKLLKMESDQKISEKSTDDKLRRLDEQRIHTERRSDERRWQMLAFVISNVIAMVAALGAVGLHFVK